MDLIWTLISRALLFYIICRIIACWSLRRKHGYHNTNLCEMPYEPYTDGDRPYHEQYLKEISNIAKKNWGR